MLQTTLCYLEKNEHYLMLHRIKKEQDVNAGKWIGIGGKFERNEAPEDSMLRETYEETGLILKSMRFRGILTFIYAEKEPEYIFTYTSSEFVPAYAAMLTDTRAAAAMHCMDAADGKTETEVAAAEQAAMEMLMDTMPEARIAHAIDAAAEKLQTVPGMPSEASERAEKTLRKDHAAEVKKGSVSSEAGNVIGTAKSLDINGPHPEDIPMSEGVLRWVPKQDVLQLNLWEGDRFLLDYLLQDRQAPFSLKLIYDAQDDLVEAYELSDGVVKLK